MENDEFRWFLSDYYYIVRTKTVISNALELVKSLYVDQTSGVTLEAVERVKDDLECLMDQCLRSLTELESEWRKKT